MRLFQWIYERRLLRDECFRIVKVKTKIKIFWVISSMRVLCNANNNAVIEDYRRRPENRNRWIVRQVKSIVIM